jgi:hypothetical protein
MSSEDDFQVGYKRPPRHSRFAPGRSGNPRGRQKGVRDLATDVKRTLEAPVKLNEQGKARRVSTQAAALMRLREMALNGDARSLDRLLQVAQRFNNIAASESHGHETVAAEDQAILEAYAAEIRSAATGNSNDSEPNADD